MNANRLISLIVFFLLALSSACAPAMAPTAIVQAPAEAERPAAEEPAVELPVYEESRPQATLAPASEEEPAFRPPADNEFQDYGVNPETDARYDHLSTFALDVDTASYNVTRRYLNDGFLPPYDAVRVEEFVNSFDQGYRAPSEAVFSIYADGAPSPQGFEEDEYILRFGVQGYAVDDFDRKPSVLTFVIDVSGSMARENRLELVKRALRLLVNRLDERDSVAIVVYGSSARTVLKPTRGDRHGVIINAIEELQTEGSTNVEAGLKLGYRHALASFREDANNRIVLCSDGVANVGNTDAETILQYVQGYVDEGIYLTTVGFGMGNFNDVLLEQLADRGNGNYAYVDTLDEARELFVENLTSTLQVIARDARVQVDFNPDVVARYRLIGYENRAIADQDFRDDTVDAGELGAGHTAAALYTVRLKPGAEGRIATVQLRWEDPDTNQVREVNGNFNTWDLSSSFKESDLHYQLVVTAAEFAEILRESPYIYASLADLYSQARVIARQLPEDEQAAELVEMIEQAARLR